MKPAVEIPSDQTVTFSVGLNIQYNAIVYATLNDAIILYWHRGDSGSTEQICWLDGEAITEDMINAGCDDVNPYVSNADYSCTGSGDDPCPVDLELAVSSGDVIKLSQSGAMSDEYGIEGIQMTYVASDSSSWTITD